MDSSELYSVKLGISLDKKTLDDIKNSLKKQLDSEKNLKNLQKEINETKKNEEKIAKSVSKLEEKISKEKSKQKNSSEETKELKKTVNDLGKAFDKVASSLKNIRDNTSTTNQRLKEMSKEIDRVSFKAKDIGETSSGGGGMSSWFETEGQALENLGLSLKELNKDYLQIKTVKESDGSVTKTYNDGLGNTVKIYEKLTAKGSEYKAVLEAINTLNKNATSNVKYIKSMDDALKRITLTEEEISDIGKALGGDLSTSFKVSKADIKANGDSIYELRNNLDKVVTVTKKTVDGTNQFSASLRKVKKNAKEAREETGTWMYSWKQAWQSFLTYMTVTDVFYKAYHTLLSMIKVTTELDGAFVELRKVTDLEGQSLKRFSEEATKMGREVAKTTKEMIESATAFAKAGYSDAEVLQLGKIAAMYTNIADEEISTAEAAEFIIAQLKAFNFEADKSMHIIDAVNEVSNNYAVSSTELAENLGKVAATLSATGTSFEESLGLLTAITEQTRNATTAANALKTLSARLRGLSDESGDYSELVPKLSKEFRSLGIEMYDVDGQIKSTYELTKDLSKVWKTLDKNTQAYLGELFAGKYQLNNFFALMNNFESAIKATETAMKSEGSALEENAKAIDSVEGHLQSLRTSWEALSKSLVDTNVINTVLSSASLLLQGLNKGFKIFNNTFSRTVLYFTILSKIIQLIKKTEKGEEIFKFFGKKGLDIKASITGFAQLTKEIGFFGASSQKIGDIWKNNKIGISIIAISAAITLLSASVDKANKEIDNLKDSLNKLEDYKNSLSDISEKLKDNNMLSSDRNALTEELLDLQKKLNEEYGITLKNINLKDNSRLREEIDLTKKLIEKKEEETALELLNKMPSFSKDLDWKEYLAHPLTYLLDGYDEIETREKQYSETIIDIYKKTNSELKNAFNEFEELLNKENVTYKEFTEKYLDIANVIDSMDITDEHRKYLVTYLGKLRWSYEDVLKEVFDEEKIRKLYSETFGIDALVKTIIDKGIDTSAIKDAIIKGINEEGFSTGKSVVGQNVVFDDKDLQNFFFKLIELSNKSKVPLEEVWKILVKINPALKGYSSLIDENVGSFERFKEELADIKDIYNTVTGALNEWNQNGYLSLDTLSNLMANWDKYSKYIEESNGALVLNEELLKKETEAKLNEIKATMYSNAIKEINRIMELDEAGAKKELIDKTQEQARETNKLAEAYLNLAKSEAVEAEIKGNTYKGQLIQKTFDDIENGMKLLNASMKNIFGSLNLGSVSTSTKAWWEKTLDNLKDQFSYNEITINEYISGLEKLLGKLKKGTDAWKKVNEELQKQRLDKLKDDYSAARISLSQYIDGLQLLIKSYKEGTDAWNNLASEIKKAKLDALKKEQDDLNGALSAVNKTLDNQIKSYQDLKEASDKRYEDEIDNLKKLADSLSDSSDEYKKAQQATLDYLDEQLNILNNQKQELEDYYDTVVDSLENMNKEQETAIKLAEAYETLMNAMTNKSKKVWVENIGFVWTTDQKAIEDARKNYEDLLKTATIDDINKQKENTVQSLDTQIEALQKYIDAWGDVFDRFDKEQNRNMADLLLGDNWQDLVVALDPEVVNNFADSYYNLQVQLDDVNKKIEELTDKKDQQDEYYDKLIEDLEKYKDLWGDVSSNYTDEQNRLLAQEQFGADFEAQILAKRLDTLNNFKNKYNAISKEIGAFDTMSDNASVGYSVPSFSNGGTVDFTGLAMLHGSPSRPEYVLNTDQVTNLLSNLTKPQVVSTMPKVGNSSVANYNFGNIELPNVTNAQQFINELKSLVNVTKNT